MNASQCFPKVTNGHFTFSIVIKAQVSTCLRHFILLAVTILTDVWLALSVASRNHFGSWVHTDCFLAFWGDEMFQAYLAR